MVLGREGRKGEGRGGRGKEDGWRLDRVPSRAWQCDCVELWHWVSQCMSISRYLENTPLPSLKWWPLLPQNMSDSPNSTTILDDYQCLPSLAPSPCTFIAYSMKFAQNSILQLTNAKGLRTSLVFTTSVSELWTVVINCFFLQSLKQQRDKLKKYQKKVSRSLELRCYMLSWMCSGHLPVQIHQQMEKEREIAKQLLRDGKKK